MSNVKYSIIIVISLLAGCGGGDDGNPPSYYSIGGTISGLEGEGLILQNNSGDDLVISSDGVFSFTSSLENNSSYSVTISVQPTVPGQTCTVLNAGGTVSGSDVNNVLVNCLVDSFPGMFDTFAGYSNDLYVDTAGDDTTGDGSQGNPYATLEKAAQSATPGTRINMADGNYAGGMYIANLRGTANSPIAIIGSGNTLIDGGIDQGLQLSKPAYLVLDTLNFLGDANGLNIDDGGEYDNTSAAEYIIIKNSFLSSLGAGNNDALKASGVNHLTIVNSHFSSVGSGSSAIDLVGCHNVVISQNTVSDSPASGVQTKGGSSDVLIHGNYFANMPAGSRAINAGGSTGTTFFRPPLVDIATDPTVENTEASRITMLSNVFNSVSNPVSFTGCVDCVFANNTIIDPTWYIVRILQESVTDATYKFAESQNGDFLNNIVRYSAGTVPVVVNIGINTQAETFSFDNNLWWATDQDVSYITTLPASIPPETASLYQLDPVFIDPVSNDFHIGINSPVLGMGTNDVTGRIGLDYDEAVYTKPPAMGAFEGP